MDFVTHFVKPFFFIRFYVLCVFLVSPPAWLGEINQSKVYVQ